jgi:predicted TIM-barrel fold metal-dependent hydrolase
VRPHKQAHGRVHIDVSELPWVISVDDHVVEPPHVWQAWLPERLRDRGPRVVQDSCHTTMAADANTAHYIKGGDGPVVDWWVYEDVLRPIPQVSACVGFPREALTLRPIRFDEMRRGCWDPLARLADMDVNLTERSLCFPTFPRFAGQLFSEARDKDLAVACIRAYNDWMVHEWCGDSGGRLIPLCIVPLWDPDAAGAEVRRNAARGVTAVAFTELPTYLGLPSIHDRRRYWDPFLRACDETGTVICMHIGSGSRTTKTSNDAPAASSMALTSLTAYMSMADWLLSGHLARLPHLRIAFCESQIGWMPFLLERLDKIFMESHAWAELDPVITDVPSSYMPGQVFGCFFDDTVGIEMRDRIGVTQLVFETDYPHQDSTWPHSDKVIEAIAAQVTPAELEMLVYTNAITMLGLDPARRPPSMAKPTGRVRMLQHP